VPVLLNSVGHPEPPTHVVGRLRAIHAGLSLKFVDHTGEHWAVCLAWQPEDTRWARVQSGRTDPASAYDIIGFLPVDCPAEQAPAHLERVFRTYPKDEVRNMADAVLKYNDSVPVAEMVEEAIAEVLDRPDPSVVVPKKRGRPRKNS
jgi:hypothetical protein